MEQQGAGRVKIPFRVIVFLTIAACVLYAASTGRAGLRTNLAAFHPDFLGLTDPPAERARVYAMFGVAPERFMIDAHRSAVNHPTAIYVIDPAGYLRLSYNAGGPASDMAHDIRRLLGE